MPISLLPQIFFISLLLICSTNCRCTCHQTTLLLDLKKELKLVWWNQTDNCCSWEGVECDGVGHVISLQLDGEGIYGGLDSSSTLFSLRYLKKLNLEQNDFYNAQIPRGIGNLTYLTHLDLAYAHYNDDMQALKLEYPDLGKVLRNPTGLKELYLDNSDISGDKSEWYNIISSSKTLRKKHENREKWEVNLEAVYEV